MEYVKSPLNYTGGKYKLLPQLLELFPKQVNTFVDLFAGGGNVSVNVKAEKVVFNDLMWQVPEMLQEFKKIGVEESLRKIDGYISSYDLSKENKEGYLALRELYNKGKSDPLMLYTLICYSFNNQIRFNNKGAYNMPFGKDRSSFNPTLREKFIIFVQRLQSMEIQFSSKDFRELDLDTLGENDFVYCDPPYTHSQSIIYGAQDFEIEALWKKIDECKNRGAKVILSINGMKNSQKTDISITPPEGLFERKLLVNCGTSMIDRLQNNGKEMKNKNVDDQLLLTW